MLMEQLCAADLVDIMRSLLDEHYFASVAFLEGYDYREGDKLRIDYVVIEAQHNTDLVDIFNDSQIFVYSYVQADTFFVAFRFESFTWYLQNDADELAIFHELMMKIEEFAGNPLPYGMYKPLCVK